MLMIHERTSDRDGFPEKLLWVFSRLWAVTRFVNEFSDKGHESVRSYVKFKRFVDCCKTYYPKSIETPLPGFLIFSNFCWAYIFLVTFGQFE